MTKRTGNQRRATGITQHGLERQKLLLIRIWGLMGLVDTGGRLDFQRATGIPDLQRSLLSMIGNFGGVTSTELVMLTGREKAQISHTVAALVDLRLVERPGVRAPLMLSPQGKVLFERLMAIAEQGDAALTRGIPRTAIADFLALLQRLVDRSATVLAHEQELAIDAGAAGWATRPQLSTFPERLRASGPDRPMSLMVSPRLKALLAYLERGAAVTYRRMMGFSLFETIVISHIGDQTAIMLTRLIELTNRDKGQVGRMIKHLEADGLVARAPGSTTRRVALCLTDSGRAVAARMLDIAKVRDNVLMTGVSDAERAGFVATLDALTANAAARLEELRSAQAA